VELFPLMGLILTNLDLPTRASARIYNKRGTVEQWIKEGSWRRTGRAFPVIGSGEMKCVCG
jgi:hypothetical protein